MKPRWISLPRVSNPGISAVLINCNLVAEVWMESVQRFPEEPTWKLCVTMAHGGKHQIAFETKKDAQDLADWITGEIE